MNCLNHETILKRGRYKNLSLDSLDAKQVRDLYCFMMHLRKSEEELIDEYHPADEMRCPVHFCIGQEAVPAALSLLIDADDFLFSHHRSHGYLLAKGAPLKALFAELYGRETGANGGKAGSQDISMPSLNFYAGAILSGSVAISVGVGFGFQLKGRRDVVVTGFGEGATDEGVFWEAINYAALRKLPIVFLCENNLYATYSHQLKRHVADNISQRVTAFGVQTRTLFGNDVIAVYSAIEEGMQHARSGKGPFFIEAYAYRWNSHVGPEDDSFAEYRSQTEIDFWKANCPIALLEEQMFTDNLLDEAQKKAIIKKIEAEIAEAFEYAKNSPFPTVSDWEESNSCKSSPLADRLLKEIEAVDFNHFQEDALPGPY